MTEKFDKAVDVRRLSAHEVIPRLRVQLEEIFEPAGMAQEELAKKSAVELSSFMARRGQESQR